MLVLGFDGQALLELDTSLMILHRPFSHLYFAENFDYWACDGHFFKLRLHWHASGILSGWHIVKLFSIALLHHPCHNVETPGWWRESWNGLVHFAFRRVRFLHTITGIS